MANKRPAGGKGQPAPNLWLLARHDFRQPAQTLELLAGNLATARTDAERQQYAHGIAQIAASLRDMTAGLTFVARIEAEALPPVCQPVALGDTVAAVRRELAGWQPAIVADGAGASVMSDATVLAASVRGAMIYALKFAEGGEVHVAIRRDGALVMLEITFQGEHPPSVDDDMAFVELAPATPGGRPIVSLAPALVRRVLERIGGSLDLGRAGEGRARVVLSLPAAAAA